MAINIKKSFVWKTKNILAKLKKKIIINNVRFFFHTIGTL